MRKLQIINLVLGAVIGAVIIIQRMNHDQFVDEELIRTQEQLRLKTIEADEAERLYQQERSEHAKLRLGIDNQLHRYETFKGIDTDSLSDDELISVWADLNDSQAD